MVPVCELFSTGMWRFVLKMHHNQRDKHISEESVWAIVMEGNDPVKHKRRRPNNTQRAVGPTNITLPHWSKQRKLRED